MEICTQAQMTTHKQLKKEMEIKLKELQDKCKHKKLTKWCDIWWAPGHSTGASARYCKRCNLEVYKSYVINICNDCGKENSQYVNCCIKCQGFNLELYEVTKRLGKIIEREKHGKI